MMEAMEFSSSEEASNNTSHNDDHSEREYELQISQIPRAKHIWKEAFLYQYQGTWNQADPLSNVVLFQKHFQALLFFFFFYDSSPPPHPLCHSLAYFKPTYSYTLFWVHTLCQCQVSRPKRSYWFIWTKTHVFHPHSVYNSLPLTPSSTRNVESCTFLETLLMCSFPRGNSKNGFRWRPQTAQCRAMWTSFRVSEGEPR